VLVEIFQNRYENLPRVKIEDFLTPKGNHFFYSESKIIFFACDKMHIDIIPLLIQI